MRYPVRCVIIDIAGEVINPNFPDIVAKTPEASKPYIGERGLAEKINEWDVKITLDNGDILHGYECWWMPEEEYDKRNIL